LRFNHREPLLLVIEFIKPFSEQRPLAQREARNLFYQPIESLGVHGYLQAGSLFTLLLWGENSTSNGDRAVEKGTWVQVQRLDVPDAGLIVWLRNFGLVKLFRTRLKDQLRHYVACLPDAQDYSTFGRADLQKLHDQHWKIEQYHRLLKQVCNVERFQVCSKVPILNHIFAALCSFVQLQEMRFTHAIVNAYQWKCELFAEVVAAFIKDFVPGKEYLNPQFRAVVNA
jgi:hypothetical protein